MTPERLQQIRLIYERAVGLEPARRRAYLDEVCAGDDGLRREVESLISTPARPAAESSSRKRARRREEKTPLEVVPGRTTLGAYRVLEKIGAGGMGTVYLAKDLRLGRRVALKVLPPHFARDEELVRRFEQEARAVAALNHPNILTLHEIGEERGCLFIVTEYVEGKTLRERMWEGRFTAPAALDVCAQVAGALWKAHASGVVHRDIKPENLMLDDEGHVKVLDFGIAKQVAADQSVDTEAPTNARVNTASGVVLGTSTYMSPEQVRGHELDGRTDVWSLGCVLYEMVAGRPPFEEKNFGDLVVSILHGEPPPLATLTHESHAAPVEPLVLRALAKERDGRFQTAKEFQAELRRVRRLIELRGGEPGGASPAETARELAAPAAAGHEPTRLHASEARRPTRLTTSEQRKQLTVLFADLAGLAALTEGQDAEDVGELMSALWPLVDSVVESHGGEVTKRFAETFVALWGARGAREDDPERAVRAALDVQASVAEFVAERWPHEARVEGVEGGAPARLMRVGVSTGAVLLSQAAATGELSVTGDPVRLATRLQQESPVGGVLVSHDTYRHVRGVFDVDPPGDIRTSERAEPVRFYHVRRAKPRAFRVQTRGVEGVETRMIGRKGELRRLTDALESVFEEGELQTFTVLGDAGLGKSRLLYEFSNWVELLPDVWYIFNGRAGESAQGLPYALVRDVFSFRFEIQDSDPPEVAREKLERGMLSMCAGAPEAEVLMSAHFIGQLIGFDYSASPHVSGIRDDARQVRDRAFRYAARFFSDISRDLPVVFYLDDIHWADEGSLDFIDHLARECAHARVMILCLARPTLLERRPAWGEGRERHTRLNLQPLSKKESRQLVEEILRRARGVPAELREMVVGGAEGNPFYVEELIKMLIDQRVIVPGAESWSVDATRLAEAQVPPTLTGVLQARLDRLTPDEKTVLQRASVIGRVFWDGAVEQLGAGATSPATRATGRAAVPPTRAAVPTGVSAEVERVLESLRGKELVYRREASAFAGAREYIFKHALLRDVTYGSVLKRDRRVYHGRAAVWLALHSGGRVGEYAGLIAEHHERAHSPEDAAEWYGRAGRQARETYAPETAIRHYRKALDLLAAHGASNAGDAAEDPALHALRLEWCEGLGEALRVQARYSEAVEAYRQMRAAAESLQAIPAQARAWNEIALVQSSQGDNRASFESTHRAEMLARGAGEGAGAGVELARALYLQSQVCSRLGDARAAMKLADRALALVDRLGDEGRRARAECLKSLGMAYHTLGQFEQAEQFKSLSLSLYRELGDRRYVGNLLNSLGETARLLGDYGKACERYGEALQIAREIGNRNGEILYLSNLGGARVGLGEYEEAEAELRLTIEMATAAGYVGVSENYRFLAEALLGRGRVEEASEAAVRALELGHEIENQEHVAEAWRVLGLLASRGCAGVEVAGQTRDAASCFSESLSIFARIQMEAERARTLRDWARHELACGDPERGRQLREEALDTFRALRMELEVERMAAEA
ncbi:MAG TPA: protein kinase [Pyrinomonadaceae bacterium]|jgi:class 3 adenylate cyclase/tetratricopeptide (TPR) repeat protein